VRAEGYGLRESQFNRRIKESPELVSLLLEIVLECFVQWDKRINLDDIWYHVMDSRPQGQLCGREYLGMHTTKITHDLKKVYKG
jgi:hypothetical protein